MAETAESTDGVIRRPFLDANGMKRGVIKFPAGTSEEKINEKFAKMRAHYAAATGAPTGFEGIVASDPMREAAMMAPAAALGAMAPTMIAGQGLMPALGRMGLAAGAEVLGNEVAMRAIEGRAPTNTERVGFGLGGAIGQSFSELLAPLSFTAQEADDLARATTRADAIPGDISRALPGAPATQRAAGIDVKRQAPVALGTVRGQKNRFYDMAATRAEKLGLKMSAVGNPISVAAKDSLRALDSAGLEEAQKAKAASVLEAIAARAGGNPANLAQATPKPITYGELNGWKRDLTEILPAVPRRGMSKSFATGSLERLFGNISDSMETMAKGTPVEPMLKKADSFLMNRYVPTREAVKNLTRDTLQPSNIVDVFAADRQGDATLHLLGKGKVPGVLPIDTAHKIRQATFRDVFEQRGAEGLRDWWKQLNPTTRQSLAGPSRGTVEPLMEELTKVLDVRQTLSTAKKPAGGIAGGAFGAIGAAQPALTQMVSGDVAGGLSTLLTGGVLGAVLGRTMTSQMASKAALKAVRAKPGTRAAGRFAAQWLSEIGIHQVTEPAETP